MSVVVTLILVGLGGWLVRISLTRSRRSRAVACLGGLAAVWMCAAGTLATGPPGEAANPVAQKPTEGLSLAIALLILLWVYLDKAEWREGMIERGSRGLATRPSRWSPWAVTVVSLAVMSAGFIAEMRVIEEFEARSAAGGPEVAMVTMMGLLAGLFLMFAVPAYLGWRQHRIIRYEIEQYVDDVQDWNRAHPNHRDESWKDPYLELSLLLPWSEQTEARSALREAPDHRRAW